jgi:hypothetical protein
MDIYRSLYPSKDCADALEVETFSLFLKDAYRFDLAQIQNPEVQTS